MSEIDARSASVEALRVKRGTCFERSPLCEYVFGDGKFDDAAKAFRKECSALLPLSADPELVERRENIRDCIIKVLLYIGLLPRDSGFAVIARLVETAALRADLELEHIIDDFAKTHGATYAAVDRLIEKHFDPYDAELVTRVTAVTDSHPYTAKDILCDIAVAVKLKYFDGIYRDERSFR